MAEIDFDEAPWYEKRINLYNLYNFLNEIGLEPEMPNFLEKPYNWEDEFNLMSQHTDWNNYDSNQLDDLASEIMGGS